MNVRPVHGGVHVAALPVVVRLAAAEVNPSGVSAVLAASSIVSETPAPAEVE